MSVVTRLKHKAEHPGDLFRLGSTRRREAWHRFNQLTRRGTVGPRDPARNADHLVPDPWPGWPDSGIEVVPPGTVPTAAPAVDRTLRVLGEADIDAAKRKAGEESYLFSLPLDDELTPDSPLVRLALDPLLVSAATANIGMVPVLAAIRLWHSPNERNEPGSSQFFHLDYADVRQAKVFVLLHDTTEEHGPTVVIDAKRSAEVCDDVGYTFKMLRVPDERVERLVPPDARMSLTGPKETIGLVDTCRCLHMGSREARHPRTVLMIQYLSPFAFSLPWRWQTEAPFRQLVEPGTGPIERLVLGEQRAS